MSAADLEHVPEVGADRQPQFDGVGAPAIVGDPDALVKADLPEDARALDVDDAFRRRRAADARQGLLVRLAWKVMLSCPIAAPSSDKARPPTQSLEVESTRVSL